MNRLSHSLSFSLQDALLVQLGVFPYTKDPWPLQVYPRTLAVLAEILLLRQQNERMAGSVNAKGQSESAIINIWTRFMSTMKNVIVAFDNNGDYEGMFYQNR